MSVADLTNQIATAYSRLYLYFYRRRNPRGYRPSPEATAVLEHLMATGPLTVTEAASHLDRSQSSVSERLNRLVERGLLSRISDDRDRRRTLVWLSKEGLRLLEEERQVLDIERLGRAVALMPETARTQLTNGLAALLAAAERVASTTESPNQRREK